MKWRVFFLKKKRKEKRKRKNKKEGKKEKKKKSGKNRITEGSKQSVRLYSLAIAESPWCIHPPSGQFHAACRHCVQMALTIRSRCWVFW